MTAFTLTLKLAGALAEIALGHVTCEYPNKLDHIMAGAADARTPRNLHPAFYGSFDWHSCVHGYWLLARLHRRFRDLPQRSRIEALFDAQLTAEKLAVERAYLDRPLASTFERPYGWAWLLMLAAELRSSGREAVAWADALNPLAGAFARRFKAYLPKLTYPIRAGTHSNTAFALTLAHEYARTCDDVDLAHLLRSRALDWFGRDADCQAWEPGGDEFLSPALVEAECMRRSLDCVDFQAWFARFLPQVAMREPAALFTPALVSDRSDGKIVHLDGLNLSRAWCWRSLAAERSADDPVRLQALASAERHLAASLPHIDSDYMGGHWLGSFALLALDAEIG
jgi:DUF2891 family protein